ncbi:family 43 glycosylhydrolase [Paenibacillus hexagrammi]|uniref:family 43 glycosylhydrolase n=1 Tax=Paenibacillus hexagrammi TaxID=2908839 RepID=UPI002882DFC1|nr:family 43 glycosylhydrolase [Paenibacillus sp. YPD9-1]
MPGKFTVQGTAEGTTIPAYTDVFVKSPNLVTWYRFNELSGTTVPDVSGSGMDAVAKNGASITTVDAKTGIDLDNTKQQYVQLPTGIMASLDDFTLSFWTYLDSKPGSWTRLFDFGTGANAGKLFMTENLYYDMEGAILDGTSSAPATKKWAHIALTKSGNDYILYVDGKAVQHATSTKKPSQYGQTAYNYIGKSNWSADPYLDGKIGDFRLYNKGLDAAEVGGIISEAYTDEEAVKAAQSTLSLGDTSKVVSNIELPAAAANGISITWESSNPAVVNNSGAVTRPAQDQPDTDVTLTATISRNGYSLTKTFMVHVLADSIVSVDATNVTTTVNFMPKLPTQVTVRHYDGSSEMQPVVWEPINESSLYEKGIVKVKGTVFSTSIQAVAQVSVAELVSIDDVNVTTAQGSSPQLPTTVTAHYSDNTTADLPVSWNAVKSSEYAEEGSFTVSGSAVTHMYSNPLIEQRADPQISKQADGYYYFTASVPEYDRIVLRRSKTIEGLATAEEKVIWTKHESGDMSKHIWAPELHYIDGKWYIYFAAGKAEDIWAIRPYVLECADENPLTGTWTEKGMIQKPASNTISFTDFSLDATTFENNGKRYLVWAQKLDGISNLYIAEMSNPWTIAGNQTLITTPDYTWERQTYWVNEGPAVLKHNGKIFISFSASATDASYCMGLLTASDSSDLLDASSWSKSPEPVMTSSDATGQYGPGHNSFTVAEDGVTDILVYHARSYKEISGDPLYDPNRHTRVKRLTWNSDGTPNFGEPLAEGEVPGTAAPVTAHVTVTASKGITAATAFSLTSLQPSQQLDATVDITNSRYSATSVVVVMALYNSENQMVDLQSQTKQLDPKQSGQAALSLTLPANVAGSKVKVFVWEGEDVQATNVKPVVPAATLE